MKKTLRVLLTSCLFVAANSYSTSYQVFRGMSFANPASLFKIAKGELIVGASIVSNQIHFTGIAAGVGGTASSNTNYVLPYGRLAVRLSPEWVFSLDITQPYITDIQYPRKSIVRNFATETFIRDNNYSFKLAYTVSKQLAIGAGLDINNFYNGQLNFVVPPLGILTNKASSWAVGWDAGLFYTVSPSTFVGLCYYSLIVQHATGTSTWGPFTNTHLSADVKLPATLIGNVVQILSTKWLINATIRYAWWDTLRYTVLQNTALPGGAAITVPANYYNNISTELATQYTINDKWALIASIDYEPNVQPTFTRNVGLPSYVRVYPAIGAEYTICKGLKAQFAYAHVFSKPPINMTITGGAIPITSVGHAYLNTDAYDFNITYDI